MTGIAAEKKKPLFRCVRKGDNLSGNAMSRFEIFQMIKRRATEAGLPYSSCCQTFRATGMPTYSLNGGTLEQPKHSHHKSPRTTKLYDRTREKPSQDEIVRSKSIIDVEPKADVLRNSGLRL